MSDVIEPATETAPAPQPAPKGDVTPILEIENLHISFYTRAGEIPAVMDYSCKVMPGEALGIVGESGCGKSTVALGIMRDMGNRGKIKSGTIRFKGRDMGQMSDAELRDLRGSKIAMIYQEPMASLNPAMKVARQLMEVPIIHEGISQDKARKRAMEMLEAVRLPDPRRLMNSYPHQLSGGQQQRVVIAMALLSNPELLLLDEPTTALDVTVEAGIVDLVKDLSRQFGMSMLFISHNLGLILETCDRISVMYSGEAVETGHVEDVFDRMRHPYTQGLFRSIPLPGADKHAHPLIAIPGQLPLPHERPVGCNFGPRCLHFKQSVCDAGPIPMIPVKGHEAHNSRCVRFEEIDWAALPADHKPVEAIEPGGPVLQIDRLKKYYDVAANKIFGGGETRTVKANEDISFDAREAETVAIVGESGCGKSTLAKVLLGLETATEGKVTLGNRDIEAIAVQNRGPDLVSQIQMVFQNPFDTLNPSHSVGSQIIRTLEKFNVGKTPAERRERMLELLDLVKLPRAFETRMPRQLSGGQKQRIGVARAFAGGPRVVVADEPVSALDVSVQAAVTELLMDIQRESRTTMLFISHDLSVVRYIADRVVVMYLGHIVEQGTTDEIFSPPYHPYTEALLSAIPIADTSVDKKRIVLEGDIPSALKPPPGCPFQTRCRWKQKVPGNLCETQVPPQVEWQPGHFMKCHLSADDFRSMEPVISFKPRQDEDPSKSVDLDKPRTVGAQTRARGEIAEAREHARAVSERGAARGGPTKTLATGGAASSGAVNVAGQQAAGARRPAEARQRDPAPAATPEPAGAAGADAARKAEAEGGTRPPAMARPAAPDDLKRISGIGPKIENTLNGLGIFTFAQIAQWTRAERGWVDGYLNFKGRIDREDWVAQARALAGDTDED
ncbi:MULTISPECIES: dipeptide ABC transporter ATP-binding protein [unclassified Roseitalea]|uniref:dipeptide ABC transporter ATP-binding protein n=1 Tax=unclassified Roseitalea TaxID=2639107 RepID=UPI002740148F|nr:MULTISPECIES: dipeptide ABC transporter ATP-binding protein [unclassified Roseitalea]